MANADGLNDGLDIAAGTLPLVGSLFGPIGSAAGGLAGMGIRAFSQWNRSRNTPVPKRPIALTPRGVIENQQNARQISSGSLADASNSLENQKKIQNQSNAINASRQSARSSTDIQATLGRVNENFNNSLNNLSQQKYNQRLGGYSMLNNANNNMANYTDRNFMYNQVEPYNQAYQNRQNLLTASNTNFDRAGQFGAQNVLGMEYLKMSNPNYTPSTGIAGYVGDWWNRRQNKNIINNALSSSYNMGNTIDNNTFAPIQ